MVGIQFFLYTFWKWVLKVDYLDESLFIDEIVDLDKICEFLGVFIFYIVGDIEIWLFVFFIFLANSRRIRYLLKVGLFTLLFSTAVFEKVDLLNTLDSNVDLTQLHVFENVQAQLLFGRSLHVVEAE